MSRRRASIGRGAFALVLAASLGAGASFALGGSAAAAGPTTSTAAPACPASNPPNTLALVGGTPQTAKLNSPFAEMFQVTLANTNGCPVTTQVAGTPITFTAPASGPSGTFSASGTNAVLVGADASGAAVAPSFTANGYAGGYTLTASSDFGSVSFSLVNSAGGVPSAITPVAPTSQSATVGSRYSKPLQATVVDADGNPVANVTVTFVLGSGSAGAAGASAAAGASFAGGATQASEQTDRNGTATSPLFTANSTAGEFAATATIAGIVEPASFALDNLAGKSSIITDIGTAKRSATVGRRYSKPLQVKVRDGNGKPVQGTTVTFILGASGSADNTGAGTSSAGASFVGGSSEATTLTNASGIATSPHLTANTTAGSFTATATTTGTARAASFALHNLPGKPATVTAGVAANESTTLGTRFPVRLAVTITDKNGNTVPGVAVRFTAPASGASGRFSGNKRTLTVKTDSKGVAVAPTFVANSTAGGYVVRASAGGHSAAFALVNQPAG